MVQTNKGKKKLSFILWNDVFVCVDLDARSACKLCFFSRVFFINNQAWRICADIIVVLSYMKDLLSKAIATSATAAEKREGQQQRKEPQANWENIRKLSSYLLSISKADASIASSYPFLGQVQCVQISSKAHYPFQNLFELTVYWCLSGFLAWAWGKCQTKDIHHIFFRGKNWSCPNYISNIIFTPSKFSLFLWFIGELGIRLGI